MPMELVDVTEKPVDNVQGYLNHVQGSQSTYPWTLLTDPRIALISPANETQAIHHVVHVPEGRMNGVARHVLGPA